MKYVLTRLNHRLSSTNGSVLLLMDNAGCHQEDLKTNFRFVVFCELTRHQNSNMLNWHNSKFQRTYQSFFKSMFYPR